MEWKEAESVIESYASSGGHMVDVAAILSANEDLEGSDTTLLFFIGLRGNGWIVLLISSHSTLKKWSSSLPTITLKLSNA